MSIPVEHILEKVRILTLPIKEILNFINSLQNLHGTFVLQPQVCLTNPSPIIPEVDEKSPMNESEIKTDDGKTDNQLLRYLELDSLSTPTKCLGRTTFTLTKRMTRLPGGNFGFTITWMQPPKIEIVEPNSPAEFCELKPGDHIVFVGNTNVVSMNELDILDLIVKQGDKLTFEVFRPTSATNSLCPIEELALLSTPISVKNISKSIISEESNEKLNGPFDLGQSICETPKKRVNLPKIAFNENIGSGVFV